MHNIHIGYMPGRTGTTIWNPLKNSMPQIAGARRSGVDRHVCNVKATGSNPVESTVFFKSSQAIPGAFRPFHVSVISLLPFVPQLQPVTGAGQTDRSPYNHGRSGRHP
jgi:hypothetical protein